MKRIFLITTHMKGGGKVDYIAYSGEAVRDFMEGVNYLAVNSVEVEHKVVVEIEND